MRYLVLLMLALTGCESAKTLPAAWVITDVEWQETQEAVQRIDESTVTQEQWEEQKEAITRIEKKLEEVASAVPFQTSKSGSSPSQADSDVTAGQLANSNKPDLKSSKSSSITPSTKLESVKSLPSNSSTVVSRTVTSSQPWEVQPLPPQTSYVQPRMYSTAWGTIDLKTYRNDNCGCPMCNGIRRLQRKFGWR